MNVAEAILVGEYQRLGIDLLTALEQTSLWSEEGDRRTSDGDPDVPPVGDDLAVMQQNDRSLQELAGQLGGMKMR